MYVNQQLRVKMFIPQYKVYMLESMDTQMIFIATENK